MTAVGGPYDHPSKGVPGSARMEAHRRSAALRKGLLEEGLPCGSCTLVFFHKNEDVFSRFLDGMNFGNRQCHNFMYMIRETFLNSLKKAGLPPPSAMVIPAEGGTGGLRLMRFFPYLQGRKFKTQVSQRALTTFTFHNHHSLIYRL